MDWTTLRFTLLAIAIVPPMSFLVALVVAHLFRRIPAGRARVWLQRAIPVTYSVVWAIIWWVSLSSLQVTFTTMVTYTYTPDRAVDAAYATALDFDTAFDRQDAYSARLHRWMLLPPPLRRNCAQYAYMDAPCGGDPTYERTHGTLPRYLAFNGLTVGVPGWMMWGIMRWELRRENRKRKKVEETDAPTA